MNNQQAVVDQILQNLTFEVEAVPKKESIHTTSMTQSTPLNLKIKVRKKDGINMQQDVSSIADDTSRTAQKVRLVNSDRTFMTFDVFMEAEFEKKPSRKFRKHIINMLRPGICLGAVDDDDHPYMPSTSYSANITEPSVAIKSDGTLKQTFTLSKNAYQAYSASTQPEVQKWLFGNCKPGGCLDPPFSEDKYAYKPSTRSGPEREEEELLEAGEVEFDVYSNKKSISLHDEETQSNGRHSSIFDSGLIKKKRKSSDKSTNTTLPDKTDSIVDIYLGESATTSVSTHSNPIITYPPKRKSDSRISDDKTVRSRGPSEDKPRKSFNDHSEPYFVPPKGVQRIKDKVSLDPNAQPKHRSSDAADTRDLLKESFKMRIPVPIPIHIPTISSKRKPEVIVTNDDIKIKKDSIPDQKLHDQDLKDQGLQDQELQHQELPDQELEDQNLKYQGQQDQYLKDQRLQEQDLNDQELQDQVLKDQGLQDQKRQEQELLHQVLLDQDLQGTTNLKDTEITPRLLLTKSTSGDTDDKLVKSSKIASLISSNVKEPNAPFETDDNNLNETKLQPLKAKDSENNVEDTANKKKNTDFFNIPLPVPVPFPLNFSDPNRADAVDSKTTNDYVDGDMKLTQPRNFFETKTTSSTIKDTPFEGLKDMQQNKEPGFGENESLAKATLNLEHSYIETDAIPENYLRTRDGTSDQESDTEMPVTIDVERDSMENKNTDGVIKPAKQSDIKDKATIPTMYTEEDIKQDFEEEKIIDGIVKPPNQKDIEEKATTPITYTEDDIKRDSEGENITDEIENPTKQSEIIEKSTIPSTYPEEDTKRYSKEGTITDRIEKPAEQKDIKDKVTIPAKYSEEDIKGDSKGESITDEIENTAIQKDIQDKPTTATKYTEDSLGASPMPDKDKHQIKGTPKKDERKDSQRISLSKLPILQKNISLLSESKTSAESVKFKTKRDDTPDKYLDNIRYGDTDLGIHKDEQRSSLPSEPEYETDTGDGETSHKEYISKTTKPNNDDKMDSYIESQRYTNDGSMNIIATPVTIDNTEDNSIFEPVKEVYTETSLVSKLMEPNDVPFTKLIVSRFKNFDDDEDVHPIGTKSVINETDGFVPSTSAIKHAERTPSPDRRVILPEGMAISCVQSVSTLKSAMKKDTISIDFGFHSYLNDKNERIVQTIDSVNAPKRLPNDLVTIIKSQIRISSNEIRIPVDLEYDMSIQIKKANASQRVSISESGLVNGIDKAKKQIFPEQCSGVETRSFKVKADGRKDIMHGSDATADRFLDYYEQELVPLQLIIKNLKEEIDFLATQQLIFKDKLYCPNKSKLPRLVHSNKKCFGCLRK